MRTHSGQLEHSELHLIGGVSLVIAITALFGFGLLTGANAGGHLERLVERPATILPALRVRAYRPTLASNLFDPSWRRFGEASLAVDAKTNADGESQPLHRAATVRGRVERPAGTPATEKLSIIATNRRPTGLIPGDARRATVAPDGSFELPVFADEERIWLALESRFLRLEGGRRVRLSGLSASEEIVLAPRLGARVSGVVNGIQVAESAALSTGVSVELATSPTGPAFRRLSVLDGTFDFGGVATEAPMWLRTKTTSGRTEAPQAFRLEPGEHRTLTFSVSQPAAATGLAVDDRGTPLANVTVRARPHGRASGRGDHLSSTDTMGRFNFEDLESGPYILFLEDEPDAERVKLELVAGETLSGLRLRARGFVSYSTEVRWPDGQPAQFAIATLISEESGDELRVTADELGVFAFERVPNGQWTLDVCASRIGSTVDVDLEHIEVGSSQRRIALPTEEILPVELGGRSSLQVQSSSGSSDSHSVSLRHENGHQFDATFASPRFQFEGLEPGSWELVVADEHGRAQRLQVPLAQGESRVVVLGESAAEHHDPSHADVALNGQLRLGPETHAGEIWLQPSCGAVVRLATDPFGRFDAGLVPAGPATVRVLFDGYAELVEHGFLVPRTERHTLELEFPTGALEGLVADTNGNALAGLPVTAYPTGARSSATRSSLRTAMTDAQGRFFMPFMEAGAWRVEVDGRSRQLACSCFPGTSVQAGASTHDYVLSAGSTLLGRIEDGTGAGVPNAELFSSLDGGMSFPLGITSDKDGNWAAHNRPLGVWSIFATTSDGRISQSADVTLAADERRAVTTLVLAKGASIRVLPADHQGNPLEAWVELYSIDGKRHENLATQPGDGTLHFGPLKAGTYWVRAVDVSGVTVTETIEVSEHDRTVNLTFGAELGDGSV